MKTLVLVALLSAVLVGCAGASPSVTAVSSVAAASSPSATSGSIGGADYPYRLNWPAEQLVTDWQYASEAWDGTSRVDHGDKYTDHVRTKDGDLFAFGYRTSEGAAELRDLTSQQAAEWHGCDKQPTGEKPLTGGGADGIVGRYQCGSTTVLRWFGVHEGFGLAIGLIVNPQTDADQARSHFEEHIRPLVWR